MSRQKPKRDKKYPGPKRIIVNNIATFFDGMSDTHASHLQEQKLTIHLAMSNMARGVGDARDWDNINEAISLAIIMVEQGIGAEYAQEFIAARDVLVAMVLRYRRSGKFGFTGDELKILHTALDSHESQVTCIRGIDLERAAREVDRRLRHNINTTPALSENLADLIKGGKHDSATA